jgi:hypothetical protein
VAGVLRGERPELTAALADTLSAAAAALRTLAAEPPRPPAGSPGPAADGPAADGPAAPGPAAAAPVADGPAGEQADEGPAGPAVQHIEIA